MVKTESGILLPNDYQIYVKPTEREISQRKLEGYKKLAEIKQWGLRYPTKFLSEFVGVDLLDSQEYTFMMSWTRPYVLWLESRNAGKALSLDTPIPTPNGYTTMGELKVGDMVFNENGEPTKVIYVSDIFYNHKCYEVEFEDGEKIIADSEHLWDVQTKNYRNRLEYNPKTNRKRAHFDELDEYGFKTKTTEELSKDYFHPRKDGKGNEYKYRVPKAKPLQYSEQELLIDPYMLGVWLGDGGSNEVRITCDDLDIDNMCQNINKCGYSTKVYHNKNRCSSIGININRHRTKNSFMDSLKELNLIGNKHIPKIYLESSIEQRLSLLQGLMDTDGSCDKLGRCEFSQKSYSFIEQFCELLNSLSIKHHISKKEVMCNNKKCIAYRVYFCVDKTFPCFRLKRKYDRLKDKLASRSENKSIISIKEVESVPTKCIQVDSPRKLYLCGKKNTVTHNTTKLALYAMLRGLLHNNYRIYICSGTADQSQETFRKIEDIALKNIESMTGLTDVFRNEVEVSQANSNGFIHNPMGFTYKLYNGSFVKTLNSNINAKRGKRAEAVYFDEGGWLSEEEFNVIGAFTTQSADFKLGGDVDVATIPREFPHQLLYASSASSVDTAFYQKYRDFSKRMLLGDPRYFVADLNCDIVINTTFRGKVYPASLLNRETIENEIRNNPEKAMREYYNQFTQDGGVGQIIKRALIVRNSFNRPPVLCNDTNERKFVFAYDPARSTDNSILGIGELLYNEEDGYTMDIVNVVSFADLGLRRKTPMMTQDQIKEIRKLLLDYNGDALDYDNIEIVLADAGAGGGGNSWVRDSLIEEWKDKKGKTHHGLLDKEYANGDVYSKRYPDAVEKLKLIEPSKYKSEMFEALIKMVEADKIHFTEKYDNKGYLNILEVDSALMKASEEKIRAELDKMDLDISAYEELLEEKLSEIESAKTTMYKLTPDEEVALVQIDAMKEEIVNICRVKRDGGKDGFKLPAHKDADTGNSEATMHDDRAYVLAMLGWYLSERRMEHIRNKKKEKNYDITKMVGVSKKPQKWGFYNN